MSAAALLLSLSATSNAESRHISRHHRHCCRVRSLENRALKWRLVQFDGTSLLGRLISKVISKRYSNNNEWRLLLCCRCQVKGLQLRWNCSWCFRYLIKIELTRGTKEIYWHKPDNSVVEVFLRILSASFTFLSQIEKKKNLMLFL